MVLNVNILAEGICLNMCTVISMLSIRQALHLVVRLGTTEVIVQNHRFYYRVKLNRLNGAETMRYKRID